MNVNYKRLIHEPAWLQYTVTRGPRPIYRLHGKPYVSPHNLACSLRLPGAVLVEGVLHRPRLHCSLPHPPPSRAVSMNSSQLLPCSIQFTLSSGVRAWGAPRGAVPLRGWGGRHPLQQPRHACHAQQYTAASLCFAHSTLLVWMAAARAVVLLAPPLAWCSSGWETATTPPSSTRSLGAWTEWTY